jgi:hypothetical protein
LKTFEAVYHNDIEEDSIGEIIPFVACGKDEELDSDMNYSLSMKVLGENDNEEEAKKMEYQYIEPRQKPIDPPYKAFLAKRNELNNN